MKSRSALWTVALILSPSAPRAPMAQVVPATTVSVRGAAFDSLRTAPLAGAFVAIAGTGRSALTDSLGRFHFDSLPPGNYRFTLEHAVLDSLGLTGVAARLNVGSADTSIIVAVPSFATLWRGACGTGKVPADSALVFGTIADAAKRGPVANANVDVIWLDLHTTKAKTVSQRHVTMETRSDASGSYALCGVPANVGLRIMATADSSASGAIDLAPQSMRVRRRDLLLGPAHAISDSALLGAIAGALTTASGAAVPNVRVVLDDGTEVLSAPDGRYLLRGVRPGTRQVDFSSIGTTPVSMPVDVPMHETVTLNIQLEKATTLATVNVKGTAPRPGPVREFEERKRLGLGYFRDSTEIQTVPSMLSLFGSFPSVTVSGRYPRIADISIRGFQPCLFIDGQKAGLDQINDLYPDQIAAMEVYPSRFTAPGRFADFTKLCPVLAIWTKLAFAK
jgi:hypothetical protein